MMGDIGQNTSSAVVPDAELTAIATPFGQTAIEVIRVGRRDPKTEGWLIRDLSFTVNFGDRLGILGPSGAGKTLLMRALAMLDPLDEGALRWKGRTVRGEAVPLYRKHVIYLHQRPALYDGSVEDNLRLPFSLKAHRENPFDRGRTGQLLASLGRDAAFLGKSSRDLSGGEAQIVAFVRAVQLDPAVLLLDEPTASLDPAAVRALEDVLDRWLAARPAERAVVWVSHDRNQALRMTGRTISLRSGLLQTEL